MKVRKILALGLSMVMFASLSIGVSAATLRDLFDADYYREQYPDLDAAFGDNEEALYKHYLEYGISEGRIGSLVFDVTKYREKYSDLNDAFGDDWDAYANHYLTLGVSEEREGGGKFDAVSYAKRYDDIYEAYGLNFDKLYEHYQAFGQYEEREALSETEYQEQQAILRAEQEDEEEEETIDTSKFEAAAMQLHNLASYYRSYKSAETVGDPDEMECYATLYQETYEDYVALRDQAVARMNQSELDAWHDVFARIVDGSGLSAGYLPASLTRG